MTKRVMGCRDSLIDNLEARCLAEPEIRRRIDHMLDFFVDCSRDFPAYSLQLMQRARELSHQDGYERGEAYAFCNIGLIYIDRSETLAARLRLREALEIFQRIGERHGQITCLNGLGACASQSGDFEEAVEDYRLSLELAAQDPLPDQFQAVIASLSRCHNERGEPRQALACLERVELESIQAPAVRAHCYLNQAMSYRLLQNPQPAEAALIRAAGIDSVYAAFSNQIRLEQARLFRVTGRVPEAIALLETVLGRSRRVADRAQQAECYLTLGQIKSDSGDAEAARGLWRQALELLVDTGREHLEFAINEALRQLADNKSGGSLSA